MNPISVNFNMEALLSALSLWAPGTVMQPMDLFHSPGPLHMLFLLSQNVSPLTFLRLVSSYTLGICCYVTSSEALRKAFIILLSITISFITLSKIRQREGDHMGHIHN